MRRSFLVVGFVAIAAVTLGAECQKKQEGGTTENTAAKEGNSPESDWTDMTTVDWESPRPFSNSTECKFCHPRQFQEWRTSPHAYSGVSPTFYSLVSAGQQFGAGLRLPNPPVGAEVGAAVAGGVGSFCMPCHAPMGFVGLEGRYGGNNAGFANVEPIFPFVCTNNLLPCTNPTSATDCETNPGDGDGAGRCTSFEGRSCLNTPPQDPGNDFPRQLIQCELDSDCGSFGPCVIGPATLYYHPEAQEGINCEVCHNVQPNHQRSCQLFRMSDSTGVLSIDLAERETPDGRRLRYGPYPLETTDLEEGCQPGSSGCVGGFANDTIPPVLNAFHESARVETPLAVAYQDTDWAFGVPNLANNNVQIARPTALTCGELPYCRNNICEGGLYSGLIGGEPTACTTDFECGGCGSDGTCGVGPDGNNPTGGNLCWTSVDCGRPAAGREDENLLVRGGSTGGDETVPPLTRRPGDQVDRVDGNYYRSSQFCATCHDVRPPFFNTTLRSCQEQPTQVCSTNDDCVGLGIGCSGGDCGPCVMENNSDPALIADDAFADSETLGDPRNTGIRRVENLFSEWQLSVYNHPELTFCSGDSFLACDPAGDPAVECRNGEDGLCNVSSPFGKVITCQDCHTSNFPLTALATVNDPYPGPGIDLSVRDKNELYPKDLAALEGSQTDFFTPLPLRRVSTHFMAGVDLPLVRFPGQAVQVVKRQQIIDSAYKIVVENPCAATVPVDEPYAVEVTIENVGVGHRLPAGFSHERQNWVQMYVQTAASLNGMDPFDPNAPCNLQRFTATGADQYLSSNTFLAQGAVELARGGCVYRSGFILDKGHPETGESSADGNLRDEDPEDFLVVVGTRTRGIPGAPGDPTDGGTPRIEVNPGADGQALVIQFVCEESTAESYDEGIADGTGIGMRKNSSAPHQVRFCDPNLSPQIPGEDVGFTAPGFGNPDCMEFNLITDELEDLGPCVPEIELSDGNERGSCANDLTKTSCQNDADCGPDGPCLYRCSEFIEVQCCDEDPLTNPGGVAGAADCQAFYATIGTNECEIGFEGPAGRSFCAGGLNAGVECNVNGDCASNNCLPQDELSVCIRGPRSGQACGAATAVADCAGIQYPCGEVGECNVENRGIVNFQNQFRSTFNGVCVDPENARDAEGEPILPGGVSTPCLLNLSCTLAGFGGQICLVNGQCADDAEDGSSGHGDPCTNVTYQEDCGLDAAGDSIACNVERNVELNGRPSESVFIQNHPFNFNSLPPFQPRTFEWDFEIPGEVHEVGDPGTVVANFYDTELVIAARVMNRHFPMRFLRNLIGTQNVRPPFVMEAQGDPTNPNNCNDQRSIDIDCFIDPVATLGNAERGGQVPLVQQTRTTTVTTEPMPVP